MSSLHAHIIIDFAVKPDVPVNAPLDGVVVGDTLQQLEHITFASTAFIEANASTAYYCIQGEVLFRGTQG